MATTTAIAGYSGSITGINGMTEVISWNCDITCEDLDATSMASGGWKEFIEGLKGANGTAQCQGTVAPSTGINMGTLRAHTNSGPTISGSIKVGNVSVGVPVDGKVTYDVTFVFTGSVAIS